jgi:hypothetical protein
MPVMPVLWRLENCEFEASLGYIARHYLKKIYFFARSKNTVGEQRQKNENAYGSCVKNLPAICIECVQL